MVALLVTLATSLSTSALAVSGQHPYDPAMFGDAFVEVQVLDGGTWHSIAVAASVNPEWRVLPAHVVQHRAPNQVRIRSLVSGRACSVTRIASHPDFNPYTLDNNIAVIETDDMWCGTPYPGWPRIPVPTPVNPIDPDEIPEALQVYSFLQPYPGGPMSLAEYNAARITSAECSSRLPSSVANLLTDRQACYMPGGGVLGGGPVVSFDRSGQPRLVGVTSFEIRPAAQSYPGVYTHLRNPQIWNWLDNAVEGLN